MGNIFSYVSKYGNKTMSEIEFNDVDAALLSQIPYIDFVGILDNSGIEVSLGEAIEKFLKTKDLRKFSKTGIFNKDILRLCKIIKDTIRYRNIILKNYVYTLTQDEQFGAITMILPNKIKIIAYEGTDHNMVGWEEDFAMFYKYPVPAQVDSIKYLRNNIKLLDRNVIVLGHSKGGHLSMNAVAFSPWYVRNKVKRVFNFDGPGFRLKEVSSYKYKRMIKKLEYVVPGYSLFGILLRHNKDAKVVKCSRKDILAHSVFNWEVKGTKFVLDKLSSLSRNLSQSTIMWLEMHDDLQRKRIVRDIFDYVKNAKITYIGDAIKLKNIVTLIRNIDELDDDTKILMKHFVKYNVDYHLSNLEDKNTN